MQEKHETNEAIARFSALLSSRGMHEALGYLNARTRYRYTGVYRFDGDQLRCESLFDRENPQIHIASSLLKETYCGLIADTGKPFCTENAPRDPRLEDHPARQRVQAYDGVPLLDGANRCIGSICHWDHRPRIAADAEHDVLSAVSLLVARIVRTPASSVSDALRTPADIGLPVALAESAQSPKVRVDDERDDLPGGL